MHNTKTHSVRKAKMRKMDSICGVYKPVRKFMYIYIQI